MNLSNTHIRKIGDELTRATLESAADHTRLRVILAVARTSLANVEAQYSPPDETRQEMRTRLVQSARRMTTQALGRVVNELVQCGLDPKGRDRPRYTRMIVVDGDACDILNGVIQ